MRLKIVLVLDSYVPDLNGGAYFTHRLALGLKKEGHDVLVLCPSLTERDCEDNVDGVNLMRFGSISTPLYPSFRIVKWMHLYKNVHKTLREFNPDILHLQGKFILGNEAFKAGKSLGLTMIGTNHLTPQNFEAHFKIPKLIRTQYYKHVWNWAFKMHNEMAIVTVPTQSGRQEMIKNGFKKPVIPISCGVDTEKFSPGNTLFDLKLKYNIPDKPILLFTGRIDEDKNIDIVLRAVKKALKHSTFHLVITGTGAKECQIKKLASFLGVKQNVTFTGRIPDEFFHEIYRISDIFVNACEVELQCISALEAAASGLPLILVNSLALPELIDENNPNGLLFPKKDVNALAGHIVTLVNEPETRKSFGSNSLKVAQKHKIENTIKSYVELYKEYLK